MNDDKSTIDPAMTPLFIGTGVELEGMIRHSGPVGEKAVVLGNFKGDVEWNGILQVPKGGKLVIDKSLRVREMVVGGEIVGAGDEVVVETGLLRVGESGVIDVALVRLPVGGLEQARGSVINAQLRMVKDHHFALAPQVDDTPPVAAPAASTSPTLALVSSNTQTPAETGEALHDAGAGAALIERDGGDAAADAALVQVETRSHAA
ncbi:hypothetical protein [Ramlibacter albus]|uniref:Polymer-forming cytoskeletal protein n=1 Tax=Ramlibacter albus TaxID=2079448 RepID=A0A923MCB0_9BURK|nr:hypothetical protein [Ramlibacter albus]MBC5767551.1 hypothetical protein [Ramlibacter albus]